MPGGEQLFAEAHGGCTRASGSFVAAIGLELDLRREVSAVGAELVGWAEPGGRDRESGETEAAPDSLQRGPPGALQPEGAGAATAGPISRTEDPGVPGDLLGCAGRSPAASRFGHDRKTNSEPCPAGFVRRWVLRRIAEPWWFGSEGSCFALLGKHRILRPSGSWCLFL